MAYNEQKERRRTRRLDQLFPVEFRILEEPGVSEASWHQAFSQDIGSGGLSFTVHQLRDDEIKRLGDAATRLQLHIHIPTGTQEIRAVASCAWLKCLRVGFINQYIVGVTYADIASSDNARILRYIGLRTFVKALAVTFSLLLCVSLALFAVANTRLRVENSKLLNSLTDNVTHQRILVEDQRILQDKINDMDFQLMQANRSINVLTLEVDQVSREDASKAALLQTTLEFFKKYQSQLHQQKVDLEGKRAQAGQAALEASVRTAELENKVAGKLTRWLNVHQNNRTGLVTSFEGDEEIRDWAFTYDQALAAIVFSRSGDTAAAREIFDFYRRAKKIDNGAFINAYYATTGDPAEYVAYAGPNVWLGLAVCNYTMLTGDRRYLGMARDIAVWLATVTDEEGGLKGSKASVWYSTEHNLDAYAFYGFLAALTGENVYLERQKAVFGWLNKNAYSRMSEASVKRGKGDATIATDTYAWSVSAVGPSALKASNMDPDQIMDYALSHCKVCALFSKPDGNDVSVQGFDFAKSQNIPRGGVVSCEWTAQMIGAFKVMAAYHRGIGNKEKADEYAALARDYTSELSKMVIMSPSPVGQGEFCLPYASHEMADTGHGWRTPRGVQTGSVAATAYAVLAIEGYNPLAPHGDGAA